VKKLDVNDCSFAHLTLILLLHYLVKCRSRSLAVYNNGSACVGSENNCKTIKSLKNDRLYQCCPTFLTLRATFIISRLAAGRMHFPGEKKTVPTEMDIKASFKPVF